MASSTETGISTVEKVRGIWETVELVTEEAIAAAEELYGPQSGDEKKKFVTSQVMEFLHKMEDQHHLIPDAIEGIAFQAVEFSLNFLIERLLNKLKVTGTIAPTKSATPAAAA